MRRGGSFSQSELNRWQSREGYDTYSPGMKDTISVWKFPAWKEFIISYPFTFLKAFLHLKYSSFSESARCSFMEQTICFINVFIFHNHTIIYLSPIILQSWRDDDERGEPVHVSHRCSNPEECVARKTHINQTYTVLHTGVGSHKLRQEQDDTSTVSDISRYFQKYPPDSLLLFPCTLHPSSPFYGFCLFVGSSSCQSFGVCEWDT